MNQSNQKAVQNAPAIISNDEYKSIAEATGFENPQIKLMHQTVAKGTSVNEFLLFLNIAKAQDLNPFTKEIWCYKDGRGNVITFASKDGFLKKAQSNPQYAGIRSSEICQNDKFEIDIANNQITHKITDLENRGDITGAYAIAFRKEGEPTIELVSMKTYNKANPKYSSPWTTHPAEMIKKVAEVHALKKAFGISGVQTEEDFNIVNDKALPLGTEVANDKVADSSIAGAISQVYDAMIKKLENVTTLTALQNLKKEVEKQASLRLLSDDAIEELNVKLETKLSELQKNGK